MEKKDMPEVPGDSGVEEQPAEVVAGSPESQGGQPAEQQAREPVISIVLLNPMEAKDILIAIATEGPQQDPVLTRLATTAVLNGSYEVSLFRSGVSDKAETKALQDVLSWLLILEADYLHYSGGGQGAGMTLTQLLAQTRRLLDTAKLTIKPLNEALATAVSESRVADIQAMNDVQARFQTTIDKLEGIVEALSEPEAAAGYTPQKFDAAEPAAPGKEAPAKEKRKGKAKKRENVVQTTLALLVSAIIVVASVLYARSLLTRKPTLVVYDPSDYKDILILKEARNEGTAFIGIVDDATWSALTPDERQERAARLWERVKGGTVQGLVLRNPGNKRLVQTYGDEIRVFK